MKIFGYIDDLIIFYIKFHLNLNWFISIPLVLFEVLVIFFIIIFNLLNN